MVSTNVRANETFLVNKAAQTTMPTSGNIVSGVNIALADGQLGTYSDSIWGGTGALSLNVSTDATPTIAEAPVLAIYQGNENSADMAAAIANATYPLWARPYERSNPIDGRGDVSVTKQAYRAPAHSVWILGNTAGETDAVNVLDNTEYTSTITFRGRRTEEMYGREQAAALRSPVTTPNFTDMSYTEAESISWILNHLAWDVNRNSTALAINSRFPNNSPVLAFLIDTTGTNGVGLYDSDAIAAGDVVPTVITASGQTKSITLTASMAASIVAAAVAATGDVIADVTWSIVPVQLSAVTTTSLADAVMFIGLDDKIAFVDYIPQRKNRLTVGLTTGFDVNTVRNLNANKPDEGQGDSRTLDLLYKATHGQRKYNLQHEEGHPVVSFPSPIVSGETYTVYNILHSATTKPDISNNIYTPFREVVCIPSSNTTLISSWDSRINNWLASTKLNGSIIVQN